MSENTQVKCFYCSMKELGFESRIQDLQAQNERLTLELDRVTKVLLKERLFRKQLELEKQNALVFGVK